MEVRFKVGTDPKDKRELEENYKVLSWRDENTAIVMFNDEEERQKFEFCHMIAKMPPGLRKRLVDTLNNKEVEESDSTTLLLI